MNVTYTKIKSTNVPSLKNKSTRLRKKLYIGEFACTAYDLKVLIDYADLSEDDVFDVHCSLFDLFNSRGYSANFICNSERTSVLFEGSASDDILQKVTDDVVEVLDIIKERHKVLISQDIELIYGDAQYGNW